MKRGMEPFLVLNRTISSKSVITSTSNHPVHPNSHPSNHPDMSASTQSTLPSTLTH